MLESSNDQIDTADRAIDMLSATAEQSPSSSRAALAHYCVTTGEAYRLGRKGDPFEARTLLESGFRNAENAHEYGQSALAAYRMALVGANVTDSGTRGLRHSRGLVPNAGGGEATESGNDFCSALARPALDPDGTLHYDEISYGGAVMPVGSFGYNAVALQCAIARAAANGDEDLAARASLRLARGWIDFGRINPEKASSTRAMAGQVALDGLKSAAKIDDHALRVEVSSRLADVVLDTGGANPQLLGLVQELTPVAQGDPRLGALVLGLSGRIALAQGAGKEAAADFRQAIFEESQTSMPTRLADWFLLLARAEPQSKTQHILQAYRALSDVRSLLPTFDALTEESNFSLRMRPVFEAVVDASLTTVSEVDDAGRIDQAQGIVEAYRQAELQSVLGGECVPKRAPIKASELKADEVILYPILLPDRVELLYATGNTGMADARFHRLAPDQSANRAEVLALVNAMVDATSVPSGDRGDQPDAWRDAARQLYRILIEPVAGRLSSTSTLVIVPDGALSSLPFAALIDADGHYLVEHNRISVVPALAYVQAGGEERHALSVVAATLEKRVDVPAGYFEALNGTAVEAKAAVAAAANGRGMLITNFHRADLINAFRHKQVDVLHLATHASFNGRSDRSFIVADGELIPIADLREMIGRNETRGEQLDLIVLSACETGVGDDQASMGLAGVAVQAGARSALASLWQVDDARTPDLMSELYRHYGAGNSKSEALRQAQLAMIARGGDYADPNVWAAFTLLGAWR